MKTFGNPKVLFKQQYCFLFGDDGYLPEPYQEGNVKKINQVFDFLPFGKWIFGEATVLCFIMFNIKNLKL